MVPFLFNGPLTAIVMALFFGTIPYLVVRAKRKKRLNTLEEQFPESLDFLARSMRAGHAFSISLEMLGEEMPDPLGQEYRALFNEQNLGAPIDIALRNFTMRVPLLDVRFFTSSVLLQKQTGGNLSEILSRLAYVIRERFRLKGQVKAASAHGRITASVLTLLPIATMLALLYVAPGYLQGMAADSDGKFLIGGAIVAQILGNFFINKIIDIKVSYGSSGNIRHLRVPHADADFQLGGIPSNLQARQVHAPTGPTGDHQCFRARGGYQRRTGAQRAGDVLPRRRDTGTLFGARGG
jgi:tight adherence protein B